MSDLPNPAEIQQHLQEVIDREANFRLQAIRDAQASFARTRDLEQQLELIREQLAARNTYIHELHGKIEQHHAAQQRLTGDLETYARLLLTAEQRCAKLESRSAQLTEAAAVVGRALKRFVGKASSDTKPFAPAPAEPFTYFFYTSPFQIYRSPTAKLRGWCFSRSGRAITAIRARVDELEFAGTYGIEETEVIRVHGPVAHAPRPGFEIEIKTSPGRHWLSVEACLENRDWRTVLSTAILVADQDSPT